MVTGSNSAMASATAAKASCAGRADARQLARLSGHPIHVCACGSHSAGMRHVLPLGAGAEDEEAAERADGRAGGSVALSG